MSDRRELHPYGLIPVYCAAAVLGAVLVSILIDRVMECLDDRRRKVASGDGGIISANSKTIRSTSSLRPVGPPPVVSDYGASSSTTVTQKRAL